RTDGLYAELSRPVSASGPLCGQDPKRHETRRASDRAADSVSAIDQPQDYSNAWPHSAAHRARPRRRVDRIRSCLAAIAHSRFWDETDVLRVPTNVCSWWKSGRATGIASITDLTLCGP